MTEQSKFICGSTGGGKSEGLKVDLLRIANMRETALLVLDPHGKLAFELCGHLVAAGHVRRIVWEDLASPDGKVLPWSFLPQATERDPWKREMELEAYREEFKQILFAIRGQATDEDKPLLREWTDAALKLLQYQDQSQPLWSLRKVFDPGSREYALLLAACTDSETRRKFEQLERLYRRSPAQYDTQVGAAKRLLEIVDSPLLRARSVPHAAFDWLGALRDRKLILFSGAGKDVSKPGMRLIFLAATLAAIHAVRRHFADTRQSLPVVTVLEEAGANRLVTPSLLTAMEELRKAGWAAHLVFQTTQDLEPDVLEKVLANTPGGHYWYRAWSPADQEKGAQDLANPTFDLKEVYYTRLRQLHDGFQRVPVTTRGNVWNHDGELLRSDEHGGVTFLPRYRPETEDVYKTPELHVQEFRTGLATLSTGQRYVRDARGVRRESVQMLPAPWPLGMTTRRTEQTIGHIRQQAIYGTTSLPSPNGSSSSALPLEKEAVPAPHPFLQGGSG